MNVQNTISISQTIKHGIERKAAVAVYDSLLEKINAFSGIVEILAECSGQNLDAGKLFFLLSQQEREFNDVLVQLERRI